MEVGDLEEGELLESSEEEAQHCSRLATGEDQGTNEEVAQASDSCAGQGLSANLIKEGVTDEIKPARVTRAKMEVGDLEEGELLESSEEEGEQAEEKDD
ncbi:hypothetical protein CRUP_010228 [Coryphaenoides rupestris]|nr:hypothetical protein CRUP_010228 [Coryphaenoides rupestris]